MSDCLSVAPTARGMLQNTGIEAYDVAPSARNVPCQVVACDERDDILEDCECGMTTLDMIAVCDTKSECLTVINSVIHVLHEADWEPWNDGRCIAIANAIRGQVGICGNNPVSYRKLGRLARSL